MEFEAEYVCESCGEPIVIPIDFSAGTEQQYVEDCPVCCNPNLISVAIGPRGEVNVMSEAEQDHQ